MRTQLLITSILVTTIFLTSSITNNISQAQITPTFVDSLTIENGDQYTTSREVTLTLSTNNNSSIEEMRFNNNDSIWDNWQAYTTSKSWTLTEGDRTKTVNGQFKNDIGLTTNASDTIVLDTTKPTGAIIINNGNTSTSTTTVTLTMNYSDVTSGVDKVRYTNNDTWGSESWENPTESKSWDLEPETGEKQVNYQVRDKAGLISDTYFDTINLEDPPLDNTGPITTHDYDGTWQNVDFTINLTATDQIAETYYKINNQETQTITQNGQPKITDEDKNNTLQYWSTDTLGNKEETKTLTQIKLDKTNPTGSIQINDGANTTNSTTITLTLTAEDQLSGVSQVRYSNNDTWNTQTWENFTSTKEWTLTNDEEEKTVYYQIQDNAKLKSTTYTATITYSTQPVDTTPPTGTITINTQAPTTTYSQSVTLTLSATDDSGVVSEMRLQNQGESWSNWETYKTTKTWTLTTGNGTKTVNAQYKDPNDNTSPTYTATINLQTTNKEDTTADTITPSGSITINSGTDTTSSQSVTLTLLATDNSGTVSQMRLQNQGEPWSNWETYKTTKTWTLTTGNGTKTVNAQYKDPNDNTSPTYTATINLESMSPKVTSIPTEQTKQAVYQGMVVILFAIIIILALVLLKTKKYKTKNPSVLLFKKSQIQWRSKQQLTHTRSFKQKTSKSTYLDAKKAGLEVQLFEHTFT